jgi:molybdopterin-guanine dinucleotide biosynthesis protein MobB/molybdenum cofactor biosynthesis protein MoaC
MESVPVLCFAGWSGSGKTTVIENLLPRLKARGLRTAVVKHDVHGLGPEKENKDSARFRRAGAAQVVLSGPGRETALEDCLGQIEGADLILVEGFKRCAYSQIGISRLHNGKGFTAPMERYDAVVTDDPAVRAKVPVFGLSQYEEITEFIMQNMEDFTHFNDEGRARMVDVGEKAPSLRSAEAGARVLVSRETFDLIRTGGMKKGDVLTVAQIAGIMGAKRTPELVPMCHPILLQGVDLSLRLDEARCAVEIRAKVRCEGKTGVEMEALTAASVAALTVYDMCKAVQKDMVITDVRLISKSGGVHGDFRREGEE